jgi:hypothetical protein
MIERFKVKSHPRIKCNHLVVRDDQVCVGGPFSGQDKLWKGMVVWYGMVPVYS